MVMDLDARASCGYVMNKMAGTSKVDMRAANLGMALYASLA
jgi:hypothetical protein